VKENEYKILDPLADMLDDKFEQVVKTKKISEIKDALRKVSAL